MIQVFKNSCNYFFKNKSKLNYAVSIFFILIFSYFYITVNLNSEGLLTGMISNIFTFSSIFSVILITFIISKIFQIRNESRDIKNKVIMLSNKVTDFRRICDKIFSSYEVWDGKTKAVLENKYKMLTYRHLYDDYMKKKPKKLIEEFINDQDLKGAYFYLALRDLVRVKGRRYNLELYGNYLLF